MKVKVWKATHKQYIFQTTQNFKLQYKFYQQKSSFAWSISQSTLVPSESASFNQAASLR